MEALIVETSPQFSSSIQDDCFAVVSDDSPIETPPIVESQPVGVYTAEFQAEWSRYFTTSCTTDRDVVLVITCTNGVANVLIGEINASTPLCQETLSNTIECSGAFAGLSREFKVVSYTCTAMDEIPTTHVELSASSVTCTSTLSWTTTHLLRIGIACGGSKRYFQAYLDCDAQNEIETADPYTCQEAVTNPPGSTMAMEALGISTSSTWSSFASDDCFTYQSSQVSTPSPVASPPVIAPVITTAPPSNTQLSPTRVPSSVFPAAKEPTRPPTSSTPFGAPTNSPSATQSSVSYPQSVTITRTTTAGSSITIEKRSDSVVNVTLLTPPLNGNVDVQENENILYEPNRGFAGRDVFVVDSCDVGGRCEQLIYRIEVVDEEAAMTEEGFPVLSLFALLGIIPIVGAVLVCKIKKLCCWRDSSRNVGGGSTEARTDSVSVPTGTDAPIPPNSHVRVDYKDQMRIHAAEREGENQPIQHGIRAKPVANPVAVQAPYRYRGSKHYCKTWKTVEAMAVLDLCKAPAIAKSTTDRQKGIRRNNGPSLGLKRLLQEQADKCQS